jgi:hypothetical protein
MHYSIPFDVGGPALLLVAGGGFLALCAAIVVISVLECLVLWLMHWGSFKRALLAAFVMNIATTILGVGIVPFTISLGYWGLLIDLLLSILAEGGILMLFKSGAARQNWLAALAANTASYVLIILPLYLLFGLLK